jgi:hypothetical protein
VPSAVFATGASDTSGRAAGGASGGEESHATASVASASKESFRIECVRMRAMLDAAHEVAVTFAGEEANHSDRTRGARVCVRHLDRARSAHASIARRQRSPHPSNR